MVPMDRFFWYSPLLFFALASWILSSSGLTLVSRVAPLVASITLAFVVYPLRVASLVRARRI